MTLTTVIIKNLIAMVQFYGAFRFAYSNGGLANSGVEIVRLTRVCFLKAVNSPNEMAKRHEMARRHEIHRCISM